ncbi:MAG: bifunctional nuclease family protein [Acidimicrobiia bacterium]
MVELELIGIKVELPTNTPVILLRETAGARRILPVYIDAVEARAIQFGIEQVATPRPLTHDLFIDTLAALGVQLQRLLITELRESPTGGTFFAELELATPSGEVRVSSRPSDGVALAVRSGAPIFAAESVLERAATPAVEEEEVADEEIVDQFREFLDDVNPEDFAS